MNQPYWFKKNPSSLSYKGISFKTLKKNALVKEFSKENPLETKDLKDFPLATKENAFAKAFFFRVLTLIDAGYLGC